jgi:large subunit ribosomal protein L19e
MIIMKLAVQKRLSSRILKTGEKRVKFDPNRLDEVKEAITAADLRGLISEGAITAEQKTGTSRGRARKIAEQKKKGRRKGQGSRKGKATARTGRKDTWIIKIRLQRKVLSELKEKGKISQATYTLLYRKAKGGFFRSKRHLTVYIEEQGLMQDGQ